MKKQILAIFIVLTLSLTLFSGCVTSSPNGGNSQSPVVTAKGDTIAETSSASGRDTYFSTQEEIVSKLTNYCFTLKSIESDGTSTLSKELYIKDEVLINMMDDSTAVTYTDYRSNQTYSLDTEAMSGYSSGSASANTYGGGMLLSILVNYGITQSALLDNGLLNIQKVGTEAVAGQSTSVYTYTYGGATVKFWIDEQYGLALKMEGGTSGDMSGWEVTEFKAGGVTPTDWINLSDYAIS